MRTIHIPVHNIEITLTEDGGGSISSELHEPCPTCSDTSCYGHCDDCEELEDDWYDRAEFNKIMDGLESYILARAIAGCDVESPAELEALETALEGIGNNV